MRARITQAIRIGVSLSGFFLLKLPNLIYYRRKKHISAVRTRVDETSNGRGCGPGQRTVIGDGYFSLWSLLRMLRGSRGVFPPVSPPQNRSAMLRSRAFASLTKFSSEGFLSARSIPARYVRCISAASASRSWDHFFSRRNSRSRLASLRFVCAAEINHSSWNFVDYESIEYK